MCENEAVRDPFFLSVVDTHMRTNAAVVPMPEAQHAAPRERVCATKLRSGAP
jgi:hypothetical protein